MAYKDLLVIVDDTPGSTARIDVAIRLANAFGAHLIGLHVADIPTLRPAVLAEFPPQVLDMLSRARRDSADKARGLFEQRIRADGEGITSEWRAVHGDTAELASLHIRYADLAIAGQVDPDDPSGDVDATERVVLGAGRPVLVVPYTGTFTALGRRIMVAWNASREATRAVNDAMPLFERAESVRVVSVNPQRGTRGHGAMPGADISLHLARHGVRAEAQTITADDVRVDDALLSHAFDVGADLIVMGAYGHSRLGEFVLGGATRHMLRQITIPVFMSH